MARWLGDDKSAWDALKPLFCGTATNLLQTDTLGKALTGPIARGDASTVQKAFKYIAREISSFI